MRCRTRRQALSWDIDHRDHEREMEMASNESTLANRDSKQ